MEDFKQETSKFMPVVRGLVADDGSEHYVEIYLDKASPMDIENGVDLTQKAISWLKNSKVEREEELGQALGVHFVDHKCKFDRGIFIRVVFVPIKN